MFLIHHCCFAQNSVKTEDDAKAERYSAWAVGHCIVSHVIIKHTASYQKRNDKFSRYVSLGVEVFKLPNVKTRGEG